MWLDWLWQNHVQHLIINFCGVNALDAQSVICNLVVIPTWANNKFRHPEILPFPQEIIPRRIGCDKQHSMWAVQKWDSCGEDHVNRSPNLTISVVSERNRFSYSTNWVSSIVQLTLPASLWDNPEQELFFRLWLNIVEHYRKSTLIYDKTSEIHYFYILRHYIR